MDAIRRIGVHQRARTITTKCAWSSTRTRSSTIIEGSWRPCGRRRSTSSTWPYRDHAATSIWPRTSTWIVTSSSRTSCSLCAALPKSLLGCRRTGHFGCVIQLALAADIRLSGDARRHWSRPGISDVQHLPGTGPDRRLPTFLRQVFLSAPERLWARCTVRHPMTFD